MSEDSRTLWVGNLHEDVTDELVYELFLQTGPIDKLIFPSEGEGENKKHKGHAYVLFKHADSVPFASKVMEGTKLFGNVLELKARSMPITYRSTPAQMASNSSKFRYDNNSLRGGFNRTNTWHGREDFAPRGRGGGGYRNKGPSNYNQNSGNSYNQGGYNNYSNSQMNSGYWMGQQQSQQSVADGDSSGAAFSGDVDTKRQRLLQQQNLIIQGNMQNQPQQQQQQGMMNMNPQMYNMQQQQQSWDNTGYNTNSSYGTTATTNYGTDTTGTAWNTGNNSSSMYQAYGEQYNSWYTQQQQ